MGPGADRPDVLLMGGFLTEPVNYARVRRRLLDRGAASVTVAPLHVPDWLAAGIVGFGPIMARATRTLREAWLRSGRPLVVIGHSGGGIVARLAMSPLPLRDRRGGMAEAVGCLVTLGSPHGLSLLAPGLRHRGMEAIRFLDRTSPGAWFAPRTAYLTVGSAYVPPDAPDRRGPGSIIGRGMRVLVPRSGRSGSDGLVSVEVAHLAGARQMTFEDVLHGHVGGPWYGDGDVIDRWWPVAVELWQEALAVRGAPAGAGGTEPAAARSVSSAWSDPGAEPPAWEPATGAP